MKSEKELAFLRDLYVSTDWGERFSQLIDEHLELPRKGRLLYLAAGTGAHPIELKERFGVDLLITAVDESEECLDIARAKALATNSAVEFLSGPLDFLVFKDDVFDAVVAEASLIQTDRLPDIVAEMARVAAPGAVFALALATASSFAEFYSIYWEALQRLNDEAAASVVETLISDRPTVSKIEEIAISHGFAGIKSWVQKEEFQYASGDEFLNSPLITDFLLPMWLEPLPIQLHEAAVKQISILVDEERQDMDFSISVKAALVVGRKT